MGLPDEGLWTETLFKKNVIKGITVCRSFFHICYLNLMAIFSERVTTYPNSISLYFTPMHILGVGSRFRNFFFFEKFKRKNTLQINMWHYITVTDVEIKHYLISLQLLNKWTSHLSVAFTNCIFVSLGLVGWSRSRTVKKTNSEGGLVCIKAKHVTISQTPLEKKTLTYHR